MGKKKKPTKPETLIDFLRDKGGVKDEFGDLKSREPDKDLKPFQRKLIQPKKGMHLDAAREAAAEAGYIPRDSSLSDLLDAIDNELRGHKVFSREDIDEVIARQLAEEEPQAEPEEVPVSRGKGKGRKRKHSELLEFVPAFVIDRRIHKSVSRAKYKARAHFLATGDDIPGVHLMFKWRNPDSRNPLHSNWKTTEDPGQSLHDFWQTLHAGGGSWGHYGALQAWLQVPYFEEMEKERQSIRSKATRHYHEQVRSLRKPGWSYKRARAEYRKRKKKKRK